MEITFQDFMDESGKAIASEEIAAVQALIDEEIQKLYRDYSKHLEERILARLSPLRDEGELEISPSISMEYHWKVRLVRPIRGQ